MPSWATESSTWPRCCGRTPASWTRRRCWRCWGAALLAAFFAVLTRLAPEGSPGSGLLRVSLAGCVITQAMVATGASSGLAGVHAAAGNAGAGLVALGWRGLWLTFWASAVPTIVFTVTGVLGLRQAGLSPPWVSVLGWLSAAAHVLVLFTLAQRGPFAPDGIIAGLRSCLSRE